MYTKYGASVLWCPSAHKLLQDISVDAGFLRDEAAILGGVIQATSVCMCPAADTCIDKLIFVCIYSCWLNIPT
jgi:hypothetical protein